MHIVIHIPEGALAVDVRALIASLRFLVRGFWLESKIETHLDLHRSNG
jgi:hypothetical protein